ncbi:DUF1598 domain-containing protein [Planctomicrobium piriforme]|uniref:DUF1598 domain-containing protein n=1 Tax=Planctomicrobium piriforme TaxID=1576369 RepID=A0A1I3F166_9PLAN|nr:DUF1598 domain-containing protein [Planctomicrobium piriforme]SFI04947.1 Protein of unknown function [Planctomicrobium piriforme]
MLKGASFGPVRNFIVICLWPAIVFSAEPSAPATQRSKATSPESRIRAAAPAEGTPGANGGANFGPLMELIQTVTEGPWFDIDAEGGTMTPFASGVMVDAKGVLAKVQNVDKTSHLQEMGLASRPAEGNQSEDLISCVPLRLVSLKRLEQQVAKNLAQEEPVSADCRYLAGLQRVEYLFVYPEQGDIVIGGPAEGWRYDQYGKAVGIKSGRAVLELDTLVTLLRTFNKGGRGIYGCSIDPDQVNLQKLRDYVAASQTGKPLSPAGVKNWANHIGDTLGMQKISVFGIPASSHVARTIVEADYKMKLIGIGRLKVDPSVPDYFTLLAKQQGPTQGGIEALRWWLTLNYDSVLHSADLNSFQIQGSAVKCQSENQLLKDNGERVETGHAEPINELFAANFTQHYEALAAKDPVFAELQGVFDLSLIAALIYGNHLDEKVHWDRGVFAAKGAYQLTNYPKPKQTESVVAYRVFHGQDVVLQVAGGVKGDVVAVLSNPEIAQESPRLQGASERAQPPLGETNSWWWDSK